MSFETVMPPYNASDPTARFLGASCLDFLLIELVPMAYRITNELEAAALEEDVSAVPGGGGGGSGSGAAIPKMDEDEERDAVIYRLDTLGYRVGQGLVERWVSLSFSLFSPLPLLSSRTYLSIHLAGRQAS
jgi:trafficking protein particle complex subunit 6